MKKIVVLTVMILASLSLSAQVQTVITGKVDNRPNKPLILLIYNFDTGKLSEEEIRIDSIVHPDHTFEFSTDKIVRPFTFCRIGFDNEGQPFRASSGDTLQVDFQYGSMDSTIQFTGKSARINYYLKEYQLRFSMPSTRVADQDFTPRDTQLINLLTTRLGEKTSLLDSLAHTGSIDSAFYRFESGRIRFEYYLDLLSARFPEYEKDSLFNARVANILSGNSISCDSCLLDYREYRDFIPEYIAFSAKQFNVGKTNFQDQFDQVSMQLSGLTKTYADWNLMQEAINNLRDSNQKELLRKYFIHSTTDPSLLLLLDNLRFGQPHPSWRNYKWLIQPTLTFLGIALFLLLFLLIITNKPKMAAVRNRKSGFAAIWKYGLPALILISVFVEQRRYFNHLIDLLPVTRFLTMTGFVGILSMWIIPCWYAKRKYFVFWALILLTTSLYFLAMSIIGQAAVVHHRGIFAGYAGSWYFIYNSWLLLLPVSFPIYYGYRLSQEGRSLSQLFNKNYLNPEFFINLVLICLLLSAPVSRMITGQHDPRLISDLILIAFIFYFHALFLVPRYVFKWKLLKYAGISVLIMAGTVLLIYLREVSVLYIGLRQSGIKIPVSWVLFQHEILDSYAGLVMQIIVIPALIYAFVRKQLIKKTLGFTLFRNKEAELNQLRSQVNPHFLFNSLNTVYAFALKENNPKTAEYIAKLANLMRYLVDDMEKSRIPVQKEISYIRDYINLQAIRSSVEHKIEINDAIGEDRNIMIAPMLMIPFVENAFKHGINPSVTSELKVNFLMKDDHFQFIIENSVDRSFEAFYKEKGFGIGIENVRQRLAHIYPGRHTLSIADTGNRFIVIMTVEMVRQAVEDKTERG